MLITSLFKYISANNYKHSWYRNIFIVYSANSSFYLWQKNQIKVAQHIIFSNKPTFMIEWVFSLKPNNSVEITLENNFITIYNPLYILVE